MLVFPVTRVAAMKSRKEDRMFGSLSCSWCQSIVSGRGCRSHDLLGDGLLAGPKVVGEGIGDGGDVSLGELGVCRCRGAGVLDGVGDEGVNGSYSGVGGRLRCRGSGVVGNAGDALLGGADGGVELVDGVLDAGSVTTEVTDLILEGLSLEIDPAGDVGEGVDLGVEGGFDGSEGGDLGVKGGGVADEGLRERGELGGSLRGVGISRAWAGGGSGGWVGVGGAVVVGVGFGIGGGEV